MPVPDELLEQYHDWTWTMVWREVTQVVTYRLTHRTKRTRYVKLADHGWYPAIPDEVVRMRWARSFLAVPRVVETGELPGRSWMMTEEISGNDATHVSWSHDPIRLARLLARGLKTVHTAPVADCPFHFGIDVALEHVHRRAEAGLIQPARDFHPEFAHLDVSAALRELESARPGAEELVVCHGDYCLPNVIIDHWEIAGFIDLGDLGVADRWWDLAVATWSLTWNLGPGFEHTFLAAYGIKPDSDRMKFYRLLYDLVS